jgi:hypothetical protein
VTPNSNSFVTLLATNTILPTDFEVPGPLNALKSVSTSLSLEFKEGTKEKSRKERKENLNY